MKYKIFVQRMSEHKDVKSPKHTKIEDSTLSNVEVQDESGKVVFKCFCCENIGPSTDTAKQDKRIVAREYQLEWAQTGKNASLVRRDSSYSLVEFKKTGLPYRKAQTQRNEVTHPYIALLLTCDKILPSFRNRSILIHIGNYPQDTEGCLLFGYDKGNGIVTQSTECIKDFFDLVKKEGVENFTLVVKEIA